MTLEYVPWSMDDDPAGAPQFKFVVFGDMAVGKTSLVVRFSRRLFEVDYHATIGVDFAISRVVIGDTRIVIQAWDTAGQERFSAVSTAYARGAQAALLVVSFDKPVSIEKLKEKRDLIHDLSPACICMLVANKADTVVCDKTHLGGVDLRELAKQLDCQAGYMAVSAKSAANVDAVFLGLAARLLRRRSKARAEVVDAPITIQATPPPISVKTCC
jgi:small GTP-binding protein